MGNASYNSELIGSNIQERSLIRVTMAFVVRVRYLAEHQIQQTSGSGLVQRIVPIPTLRRLHARGAPLHTLASRDHTPRRRQPCHGRAVRALGEARAAGVT